MRDGDESLVFVVHGAVKVERRPFIAQKPRFVRVRVFPRLRRRDQRRPNSPDCRCILSSGRVLTPSRFPSISLQTGRRDFCCGRHRCRCLRRACRASLYSRYNTSRRSLSIIRNAASCATAKSAGGHRPGRLFCVLIRYSGRPVLRVEPVCKHVRGDGAAVRRVERDV